MCIMLMQGRLLKLTFFLAARGLLHNPTTKYLEVFEELLGLPEVQLAYKYTALR